MRTALVLVLDQKAPALAAVRATLDPATAARLPFHLTLLFPFIPRAELDEADLVALRRFFGDHPAPELRLASVDVLAGEWIYAAPESAAPLLELMQQLWARYPELPPYEGEIADPVPHATLAQVDPAEAESALRRIEAQVAPELPVDCAVDAASLLEELPDGTWRELERLPFRAAA